MPNIIVLGVFWYSVMIIIAIGLLVFRKKNSNFKFSKFCPWGRCPVTYLGSPAIPLATTTETPEGKSQLIYGPEKEDKVPASGIEDMSRSTPTSTGSCDGALSPKAKILVTAWRRPTRRTCIL